MISEIIFDVETKKLFSEIEGDDPADLGVSLVSLYERTLTDSFKEINGKILSFWEADFPEMWDIFQKADRIVGFNSLKFDVLALLPYAPFPFRKLPHFDIMDKVKEALGTRISLQSLSNATLDRNKSDSGVNAVFYWQSQEPENLAKLKKYCEDDVLITKEIYDFGLMNGFLKYYDKWNTPKQFTVDFSFKNINQLNQNKLF